MKVPGPDFSRKPRPKRPPLMGVIRPSMKSWSSPGVSRKPPGCSIPFSTYPMNSICSAMSAARSRRRGIIARLSRHSWTCCASRSLPRPRALMARSARSVNRSPLPKNPFSLRRNSSRSSNSSAIGASAPIMTWSVRKPLVAQVQATLPPLEGERSAALFELDRLVGQTPSNAPTAVGSCVTPPQLVTLMPVAMAGPVRRRPDIREADRNSPLRSPRSAWPPPISIHALRLAASMAGPATR